MRGIKRLLMILGGITLLVVLIVIGVALLDTGKRSGVRQTISAGDRTVSLSGDFKSASTETMEDGAKLSVDGKEIIVAKDGVVTIDGKPQSFGDFKELRLDFRDGQVQANVVAP